MSGLLAERLVACEAGGATEIWIPARRQLHESELVAHAPAHDHCTGEIGGLLDIALGTCGPCAVDDFFGRAPSEHADDPCTQVAFGKVVTIAVWALIRHTERLPVRHDRYTMHRGRARHDEPKDGVSALVIRDALPVLTAQESRALRAQHDLFQRVQKVLLVNLSLLTAGGQQRRFLDPIL